VLKERRKSLMETERTGNSDTLMHIRGGKIGREKFIQSLRRKGRGGGGGKV
jgi:hypothetical protein